MNYAAAERETQALGISRRDFCRFGAAATAALLAGTAARSQWEKRRMNILLITADDLGTELGCYGDPYAVTPHLDHLASRGVLFECGYVTQASCSPSRSSMFTGLYPHQNGQVGLAHLGYSMRPGQQTIPTLLKEAGYRTGTLGKVHVGPGHAFSWDLDDEMGVVGTRDVRLVAERAEAFIASSGETPFFLMVNFFDPHRPFEGADQIDGIPAKPLGPDDVRPFPFLLVDSPKVRSDTATYYNCAERLDTGVGLLMDLLERLGHDEDTLVLFIGDHGAPFTRAKAACYEAGVHIPYLMYWPGKTRPGVRSNALVSTVDLMPTILGAAGVPCPETEGRDLAALASGEDVPWRDTLCTEYNSHIPRDFFPRRSIRDDRFKLIHNLLSGKENPVRGIDGCAAWETAQAERYDGTLAREVYDRYSNPPEFELYDLRNDPHEFRNLADDAQYAETLLDLQQRLRAWRESTGDPFLDEDTLNDWTQRHQGLKDLDPWDGSAP